MKLRQLVALILIAAGVLGLLYGGFTYTQESHEAKFGPIEFSVKEKKTVDIPSWLSIGAIVGGVVLLLVRNKR